MKRWLVCLLLLCMAGYGFAATITVPNVAALADARVGDGDLVQTAGQVTADDGGGMLYRYDAGSAAVADGVLIVTGPGGVGRYLSQAAERAPLIASTIPDDANLLFDVTRTDATVMARTLSLEELKKTGVQVVNVKQYGAVGDGVTDDTAAIQAAIDAAATANVAVVYLPSGNYVVSSTLTLPAYVQLHGDGSFDDKTVIKTSINDGSAVISIDDIEYWSVQNLCITSTSGSLTNAIGISATTTSSRWYLSNVHVKRCATGYAINGWLGTTVEVRATYCTTGFSGDTINGGVLNLIVETSDYGIVLDNCNGLTLHAVVEGGAEFLQAIILDDCDDVVIAAPYIETSAASTLFSDGIDIGGTSACTGIKIIGGFVYHAAQSSGYLLRVANSSDVSVEVTLFNTVSTNRGTGVIAESTCSRFRFNGRLNNCQLQDDSSSSVYTVNLMPNWTLDYYRDGWQSYATTCTISKESAEGTPHIKTGREAIHLKASTTGLSTSRIGIVLPPSVLTEVVGKTITFGAWIYVPTHTNFEIPDYPTATKLLPGVLSVNDNDGVNQTTTSSNNTTGLCIPGGWNFVRVTHTVQSDATSCQLFIHALATSGGSTTSDGTEYVVLDSIYLCVGNLGVKELLEAKPMQWVDEVWSDGSVSGSVTLDWQRGYNHSMTLTGNITTLTVTAPYNQKRLRLMVTQGGSGSYTISFPATWKFDGGSTEQPATSVGDVTVYELWYDGTNYHVMSVKN